MATYYQLLNNIPHTTQISPYYAHSINILDKYKITKKELLKGSINLIYNRIINDVLSDNQTIPSEISNNIHDPILPNFLKTFNYKTVQNILPFYTNFRPYSLDQEKTLCSFCRVGPDSVSHTFVTCKTIMPIWQFAENLIEKLTNIKIEILENYIPINFILPSSFQQHKKKNLMILIIATVNHSIWKFRNKIIYENANYNPKKFIIEIRNTLRRRATYTIPLYHKQKAMSESLKKLSALCFV